MKLTAQDLLKLGVIDEVIEEPLGGAHRDSEKIIREVKDSIIKNLNYFKNFSKEEVYNHRKAKFLQIGRDKGFALSSNLNEKGLGYQDTNMQKFIRHVKLQKIVYLGFSIVLLAAITAIFN